MKLSPALIKESKEAATKEFPLYCPNCRKSQPHIFAKIPGTVTGDELIACKVCDLTRERGTELFAPID